MSLAVPFKDLSSRRLFVVEKQPISPFFHALSILFDNRLTCLDLIHPLNIPDDPHKPTAVLQRHWCVGKFTSLPDPLLKCCLVIIIDPLRF